MKLHKCRLKPGETRSICFTAPCPWNTNCQQLESSIWKKFVTFTVPMNISLKLARFKPSQPLMMSSGTSKWPKTQQINAIWTHFQGNCLEFFYLSSLIFYHKIQNSASERVSKPNNYTPYREKHSPSTTTKIQRSMFTWSRVLTTWSVHVQKMFNICNAILNVTQRTTK